MKTTRYFSFFDPYGPTRYTLWVDKHVHRAITSEQTVTVRLRRAIPEYADLTPHQDYVVIGIEANDFRILNDQGRPHLYPADLFDVVDPREPDDWITEYGEDGERYAYPPALNDVGFFEDFFDANAKAVAAFWHVVNQRLAAATVA